MLNKIKEAYLVMTMLQCDFDTFDSLNVFDAHPSILK